MPFIPIDEIIIPEERIRREFDEKALLELAHSIVRLGLIHPIALQNDGRTLVSGERRLRAHHIILEESESFSPAAYGPYVTRFVKTREVAYTTMEELSPQERFEVELEENIVRRDLSWQEQARAQTKLHELRLQQHGEYSKAEPEGWSIKKTAEEILGHEPSGSAQSEIADSLFLNDFLDDPLVAAAGSKKDALKVIADLNKAKARKEKADNWDPSKADHICLLASCYDENVWDATPDEFDCIIADPPYGRSMDKHSFAKKHEYDDSRETFLHFVEHFPAIAFSLTKPQAHFYIFHDIRDFDKLMIACEVRGWKVWPWPLIWDKANVGSYGSADQGPRHVYDAILFANKGEKPCIMMQRDVINITQDTQLPHPAGKPIELYAELLKRSCEPGDYVLDPMCGGGTIFPAATRMKLHATGIEKDEKYYHMAIEMAMEGK